MGIRAESQENVSFFMCEGPQFFTIFPFPPVFVLSPQFCSYNNFYLPLCFPTLSSLLFFFFICKSILLSTFFSHVHVLHLVNCVFFELGSFVLQLYKYMDHLYKRPLWKWITLAYSSRKFNLGFSSSHAQTAAYSLWLVFSWNWCIFVHVISEI